MFLYYALNIVMGGVLWDKIFFIFIFSYCLVKIFPKTIFNFK